jgi:acetyl-CoA C-acetyltransferase
MAKGQPRFPSGEVAIVGAYESPRRKAPNVHPFAIQSECVAHALEDAGLEHEDVDGFCTTASLKTEGGSEMSIIELVEYLGIQPRWLDSTDIGGAAYISHAGHAALAIAAGFADVVVVSYAALGRSGPLPMHDFNTHAWGPGAYEVPHGPSTVSSYALAAQRHMHQYGTTPEQLAAIAVQIRANAALNPDARYRDPITVEDVVTSADICSPLRLLDCCVVTDSGGAFVMTSRRRAEQLRRPPVYVLGFGEAIGQAQMNQMEDFTRTAAVRSGADAFATAGMGPEEIDCAQLYDSFTITVLLTLESLGFCGPGEGGAFVEDGNLAAGGRLPINTDGGGLSSNHPGRRGALATIEAVRQLRGDSPGAQLDGPKTCLVNGTGGSLSATSTMILGV